MKTNQTLANLEKTSETGLKGILRITSIGQVLKSKVSLISFSLSLIILVCSFFSIKSQYDLIVEIKQQMITFLPGVLGFTIAGYSLVIVFIPQANMLDKVTERLEGSEFSFYQDMSSIFALNVISQGMCLILGFFIHFFIYLNEHFLKINIGCAAFLTCVNSLVTFVISYSFALALLLVIQIVINIFNFSQTHHFFIVNEKLTKSK